MKKTATLSLVLTLICCMSAVSCGGGKINFDNPVEGKDYKISKKTEAGEVYSWTYKDFGEGVMPIAGFIGMREIFFPIGLQTNLTRLSRTAD